VVEVFAGEILTSRFFLAWFCRRGFCCRGFCCRGFVLKVFAIEVFAVEVLTLRSWRRSVCCRGFDVEVFFFEVFVRWWNVLCVFTCRSIVCRYFCKGCFVDEVLSCNHGSRTGWTCFDRVLLLARKVRWMERELPLAPRNKIHQLLSVFQAQFCSTYLLFDSSISSAKYGAAN